MKLEESILVAGGLLVALLAGLFAVFGIVIVPAMRSMRAATHIAIMQIINVKILHPAFFLSFFGPTILLPLAAYLQRGQSSFGLLVAAALLHIVGANGITMVGNVPLNNGLDKVDTSQLSDNDAEQIRNDFQGSGSLWMRLHTLRTAATIIAALLVFLACLSRGESR